MKAVLVALVGEDKIYYNLDAQRGEKDAIMERPDGSTVDISLLSFVASTRGLSKLRSSRFHRLLWDAPKNTTSGSWYETFVEKTKPVNEKMLEKAIIHSSLGKNKKTINKKESAARSFIRAKNAEKTVAANEFNRMIKFNQNTYSFKTAEDRKFAWEAMSILRHLEDSDDVG